MIVGPKYNYGDMAMGLYLIGYGYKDLPTGLYL
jgi:hypothetical protein